MNVRLSLVLTICFSTTILFGQIVNPKKVRFGKISDAELELTEYALQPDAEAVVLFDEGKARMEYDISTGGFEMVMERHYRIKILKAAGTSYGDYSLLLEHSTNSPSKEDVNSIKGVIFNMENGKAVETKLTKESIFREEISDRLDRLTISFPQVKEGSIIDLKYVFTSDFLYSLPTWYFQRQIPTDYSFFEAVIPEYYYYNLDMKGYASGRLTENVVGEIGNRSITAGASNNQQLSFSTRGYRWGAKEVLGIANEVFAPPVRNYFFRVDFELASVNFPGQLGTHFSHTWEDVTETYRLNANIRPYLNPRQEVEVLASGWAEGQTETMARLVSIFEGVKERVSWNGSHRMMPVQSPTVLLKNSSGSSAEVNGLLMSALRAEGFQAFPVLSSTRSNGYLSITRPSLSQFNHFLVYVSLNEGQSYLLLDATMAKLPANLLPLADLNDRGRVIMDETSSWINLKAPASQKTAVQLKMSLDGDSQCSGSLKYKASDYAAYFDRESAEGESALSNLLSEKTGHTFDELQVDGYDNLYSDLSIEAQLNVSESVIVSDDLIYIPALQTPIYTENPLKAEERVLPIDFATPKESVYVMQLEIPENMQLEELPESVSFVLPDNKGKYSVRYIDLNGNVQVVEQFSINESFFSSEDYGALRNFMDLVVEQQQSMLVVRKL